MIIYIYVDVRILVTSVDVSISVKDIYNNIYISRRSLNHTAAIDVGLETLHCLQDLTTRWILLSYDITVSTVQNDTLQINRVYEVANLYTQHHINM